MNLKLLAIAVTAAIGIGGYAGFQKADNPSQVVLDNLEALSDNETGDTTADNAIWNIKIYNCTISGELAVKLGLSASGKGAVSISGGRECELGGKALCKPISCVELLQVLMRKS